MMRLAALRGQGATEYLVLLAIVLVVAMVAIALLGYFPGMSTDAKMAESDSYWRGEARPFAILEHSLQDNGSLYLVVQNREVDQKKIEAIILAGSGFYGVKSPQGQDAYLSGGEQRPYRIKLWDGACSAGNTYELEVNFTYAGGQSRVVKTQFGSKRLAGKCSMDSAATESGAASCPNDEMVCGRSCICEDAACVEASLCGQDAQAIHCGCGQQCISTPGGPTCVG